ncbi:MAG TPA: hypothetical protein VGX28_09090 [Frankiaceae bacterium]|jgi:hypothetical protein|nr:hypothetical protein [Frankiaceae bacterium]
MGTEAAVPRRVVRLVDVPVRLYREAQQHTDELLRELVLMAGWEASRGEEGTATRLAGTADRHRAERHALSVVAERVLAGAAGDSVTIEYEVDVSAAETSAEWAALLDELAALCRDGGMLVVPAHGEVAAFSRWFCEEFVRQLRDEATPRSWSEARADA